MTSVIRFTSIAFLLPALLCSESLLLQKQKIYLRSGDTREWSSFPAASQRSNITLSFQTQPNSNEYSLVLRQRDVKNTTWVVNLNGQKLGALQDDERDMLRILPIPANALLQGSNTLEIDGRGGRLSDDIEISEIRIEPSPVNKLLTQAEVSVTVSSEAGQLPVKLTIVDAAGSLTPFASLKPDAYEARRTGVLYTPDGIARIRLPAGEYRIFASRGFEYSAPADRIRLKPGDSHETRLRITREVNLGHYISADPHVHTRELSGHGDATVDERVLTAAGEGLDLVITTEHNRVENYMPALVRRALDRWTMSVAGNEVTTAMGHFNIFPVRPGSAQPDPREADWLKLMTSLRRTPDTQIVVQNHPRDLHSNYRPFDPARHLSSLGLNQNGRPVMANAMEVVNSGAMYSDVMQLVHDWLGLLNRGLRIAAIGSSDTHTVDFVPIGQARTYIDTSGLNDWREDTGSVFRALAEGRNLVSYGLAAELRVLPDSLTPAREIPVEVSVYGPSWSAANRVVIYGNGQLIWQQSIPLARRGGIKYRRKLRLPASSYDTTLVAVATGPGVLQPFWEVRKPYQPMSPEWDPMVIGISSAVAVDGDRDGAHSAPLAYAERLIKENSAESSGDLGGVLTRLTTYDTAVALHVFHLFQERGQDLSSSDIQKRVSGLPPPVRQAYQRYLSEKGRVSLPK